MRTLFVNLGLLLGSCLVGLSLCEVSLRLFYPKYRDFAEGTQFHLDLSRIWGNRPHSRNRKFHPDTKLYHPYHHNNWGLRQHRNFAAADLASATNVGVFGDSFVENRGIDAPYSFTEPLDYLLNRSGTSFNVLNFGTVGYGGGQSFLHYTGFRYAKNLDFVVYVYFKNDLEELTRNGLFSLDDAGNLVHNTPPPSRGWVRFVSRHHLSYAILDVQGRLSSSISQWILKHRYQSRLLRKPFDKDRRLALLTFRKVLRSWKHLVESGGNTFLVVSTPETPIDPSIAAVLSEEGIKVIDLFDCFTGFDAAHSQRPWSQSPYSFKSDWHWNEAGNRLAAVCLYRVLEEEMRLPARTEADLRRDLHQYYAAFGDGCSRISGGGGSTDIPPQTTTDIREKYQAFAETEIVLKKELQKTRTMPDKRIIRSVFDVYLRDRSLVYIKEGCRPADMIAQFFLHVTPVDGEDVPIWRGNKLGFHNLDYTFPGVLMIDDTVCGVLWELPSYRIRHIRTGQFVRDAQGNYENLWEGQFAMGLDAGDTERRRGQLWIEEDRTSMGCSPRETHEEAC